MAHEPTHRITFEQKPFLRPRRFVDIFIADSTLEKIKSDEYSVRQNAQNYVCVAVYEAYKSKYGTRPDPDRYDVSWNQFLKPVKL